MKLSEVLFIPKYQGNDTEARHLGASVSGKVVDKGLWPPRDGRSLPAVMGNDIIVPNKNAGAPVKPDFFRAMTKLDRILAGVPQEYGFHNLNDGKWRGSFCVDGARGHVKKAKKGDVTTYTCVFPKDSIAHPQRRHIDVVDAVKLSAPESWRYVSLAQLKNDKEPCYAIELVDHDDDGDIDVIKLHVKHDEHEQLAHH